MKADLARCLTVCFAVAALLLSAACTQNITGWVPFSPSSDGTGKQTGQAGRLVVLLITDNTDHQYPNRGSGSIADGVTRNAELMDRFFQRVRAGTEMTVDVYRIAGSTGPSDPFTCNNIIQTIKTLPVSAGDAVMVYYSGHGFNIGSADPATTATQIARYAAPEFQNRPLTQFPFLACGTDVRNSPDLDLIATWLAEKKPRLTVVMSDACNSFEGGSGPAAEEFFTGGTRGLTTDLRLRSLFLEARGTVLVTGSQRGHYSYYDNSLFHAGGFFTKEFLAVVAAMPADQRTTWDEVGQQLTPMTIRVQDKRTGHLATDTQAPFLHVGEPFATAITTPAAP